MPKKVFDAILEEVEDYPQNAFVDVPFDAKKEFGSARAKVKVKYDGQPYRGSISPMGGRSLLLIRKEIFKAIGKKHGETIRVEVELDTEPRVAKVPDDFKVALLADKNAAKFFDSLSYTHQKEYVRWIEEAKKQETRERRILKAIDMLNDGTKGV